MVHIKNAIDCDGKEYLTVDYLIERSYIAVGTSNISLRNVNVKL